MKEQIYKEALDKIRQKLFHVDAFNYSGRACMCLSIIYDAMQDAEREVSSLKWISLKQELPKVRDGEKPGFSSVYSDELIVLNDSGQIFDDVHCVMHIKSYDNNHFNWLQKKPEAPNLIHEGIEYIFRTHCFGYDNDSHDIKHVTHFIYRKDLLSIPK